MKKSLRKILTILLVATIIFTSNATMIFADGLNKQNELKNELGLDSNGGGSEINPTADETNLDNEENQEEDDEEKNLGNDENEAEEAEDDEPTEAKEDDELEIDEKTDDEPADTKDEKSNEEDKQDEEGLTSDDDTGNQSDDDIETKSEEDDTEIATSSEIDFDDLNLETNDFEKNFGANFPDVKLTLYFDYGELNSTSGVDALEYDNHGDFSLKSDKITLAEWYDNEFTQYTANDAFIDFLKPTYARKDGVIYKFIRNKQIYCKIVNYAGTGNHASFGLYDGDNAANKDNISAWDLYWGLISNFDTQNDELNGWLDAMRARLNEDTSETVEEVSLYIGFWAEWEVVGTYEEITFAYDGYSIPSVNISGETKDDKVMLLRYYSDNEEYIVEHEDGYDVTEADNITNYTNTSISSKSLSYTFRGYKESSNYGANAKLYKGHLSYEDMIKSLKNDDLSDLDSLKTYLKQMHEEHKWKYPNGTDILTLLTGGIIRIPLVPFWGRKGYVNVDANLPSGAVFDADEQVSHELDVILDRSNNIEIYYNGVLKISDTGLGISMTELNLQSHYSNAVENQVVYAKDSDGNKKYFVEKLVVKDDESLSLGDEISFLKITREISRKFEERDDGNKELNTKFLWKTPKSFSFEADNGGSFVSGAKLQYLEEDTLSNLPAYVANDGYKFSKWYYKNGNTEVEITEDQIKERFNAWKANTASTASVVIYAKFVLKWQFKIELYPGDDGKGSISGTTTFNVGDSFTLPSVQMNEGYVFINYYQDTNTVCNNVSQYFANWNSNPTEDKTLYARFYDKKSIKFEIDTTKGSTNDSVEFYNGFDSNITIPNIKPAAGYKFVGWYIGDTKYEENNISSNFNNQWKRGYGVDDISYTAKFEEALSFSFNIDDEKGFTNDKIIFYDTDDNVNLPHVTPKAGYRFANWTDKDGNVVSDTEFATRFTSWKNDSNKEDIEFTANFDVLKTFKIIYDDTKLKISNTATGKSSVDEDTKNDFPATVEALDSYFVGAAGYAFAGYSLTENGTQIDTQEVLDKFNYWSTNPNDDVVIYALYKVDITPKISFSVDSTKGTFNGDSEYTDQTSFDNAKSTFNIVAKDKYEFVDWKIDYYEISTEKITKTENKPMDYVKSMSFDSNYIITITANFKNKNEGGKNNNNNTPSRRGSSGGGGGGSSGRIDNINVDPTININPDGPNPNNPNNPNNSNTGGKISEQNLMKNQNLELRLKSFSENSSSDVVSVRDVNSNVAYGKWYRIPSTTTWYFLTEDINQKVETASTGFLVNGWFNLPWDGIDKWYHFNDKGVMELGWFTDNDGKVYYLQHDFNDNWYGKKLTGVNIIDGVVYNFDENGALIQ